MPRRKYGHMVGPCPNMPVEKCPFCRSGRSCPVHNIKTPMDYEAIARQKRRRFSGKRKGKRHPRPGTPPLE